MVTYKIHKKKYRWLTNAANCIFLGPTIIITQTLHLIDMELKTWCSLQSDTYKRFSKVEANLFWVIDSVFDFTLNLPSTLHSMYMADITHCYKSIPLTGEDNLLDTLKFIIKLAFQQQFVGRHKEQTIWVHIKESLGKVDSARWSTNCPGKSCWFPLSQGCLIELQHWLISSCYICSRNATWKQVIGISMGFSCSPFGATYTLLLTKSSL